MTIDHRIRNFVIAGALAVAAIVLTLSYVHASSKEEATQAEIVSVLVPTKSFPAGTPGSKIASTLEVRKIPRSALVPEAISNKRVISRLVTTEAVFAGEQLTLRRFGQEKQLGIRAKLSGKQRALQVAGDSNQLLAGTLDPGDRVDVVANVKNPRDNADVRSLVALRDLLVLQTEGGDGGSKIAKPDSGDHAVILAVTDEQAQRLYWIMRNGDWSLQLRPVVKPQDSSRSDATFKLVLGAKGGSR